MPPPTPHPPYPFPNQVLTTLGGLQSLHLHGNAIGCLSEVDKLGALRQLHRLTLCGNPLEKERGYR